MSESRKQRLKAVLDLCFLQILLWTQLKIRGILLKYFSISHLFYLSFLAPEISDLNKENNNRIFNCCAVLYNVLPDLPEALSQEIIFETFTPRLLNPQYKYLPWVLINCHKISFTQRPNCDTAKKSYSLSHISLLQPGTSKICWTLSLLYSITTTRWEW